MRSYIILSKFNNTFYFRTVVVVFFVCMCEFFLHSLMLFDFLCLSLICLYGCCCLLSVEICHFFDALASGFLLFFSSLPSSVGAEICLRANIIFMIRVFYNVFTWVTRSDTQRTVNSEYFINGKSSFVTSLFFWSDFQLIHFLNVDCLCVFLSNLVFFTIFIAWISKQLFLCCPWFVRFRFHLMFLCIYFSYLLTK